MILIRNQQRIVSLDIAFYRNILEKIISIIGYDDFDIALVFVNDKTMRVYNKQYRNKDYATDILSFPFYPNLIPGKKMRVLEEYEKNLGDLIIAPVHVLKTTKNDIQLQEHIVHLIIHGVCHLLGYDHITDNDFRVMRRKEVAIAKKLGL